MPRTTVDLDPTVLRELKRLQKQERKPLGQLISELVAAALAQRTKRTRRSEKFIWKSQAMRARIDLEDKEAVRSALDSK